MFRSHHASFQYDYLKPSSGRSFIAAARPLAAVLTLGVLLVNVLTGTARAEIPLDNNSSLTVRATVEQQYDSNIFADSRQIGDGISIFSPFAEYVRHAGLLETDAQAGVKLQHFLQRSEEDSVDPFANLKLTIPRTDRKFSGDFDAELKQAEEADPLINNRDKYQQFQVNTGWEYFPFEKIGFNLRAFYDDRNYKTTGLSDIRTKAIDGSIDYQYSEKLAFFGEVGGRWVTTYNIPRNLVQMNSEDMKYKIGVQANAFAKVTGRFAVGWVHRRFLFNNGGVREGLLLETALDWHPDDDTTVTVLLNRDFDTTPIDQSVMQLTAGLEIRRAYNEKLAATTTFTHVHSNFAGVATNRRDDAYYVHEKVEYSISHRFTAAVQSSFNVTNSNNAISDYSRLIVGLSVTAIF